MSEYLEQHSISRMVGSSAGYVGHEERGQLTAKIRRESSSVILFDEIEKAHLDVLQILLSVLEDGPMADSQGRNADFKNTLLMMSSNAEAEILHKKITLDCVSDQTRDQGFEKLKMAIIDEAKNI
jgi:ATP-dependent Clp protease ATP-binding subunit ClpC